MDNVEMIKARICRVFEDENLKNMNILNVPELQNIIADIAELAENEQYGKAYVKARNALYVPLETYVLPHMEKKGDGSFIYYLKYFAAEHDDNAAQLIMAQITAGYTLDFDRIDKSDVKYILKDVESLYNTVFDKYGKRN